jgi:hypothetical protein
MNPHSVRLFASVVLLAGAAALAGCGEDGNTVSPDPIVDTVPPAVPVNLAVAGNPGVANISIAWDDNAEADLAGYLLERSVDRGATWTAVTTAPLTASTYQDSYYPRADYRVAAVDLSDNQSAYSAARGWAYIRNPGSKIPAQPVEP